MIHEQDSLINPPSEAYHRRAPSFPQIPFDEPPMTPEELGVVIPPAEKRQSVWRKLGGIFGRDHRPTYRTNLESAQQEEPPLTVPRYGYHVGSDAQHGTRDFGV